MSLGCPGASEGLEVLSCASAGFSGGLCCFFSFCVSLHLVWLHIRVILTVKYFRNAKCAEAFKFMYKKYQKASFAFTCFILYYFLCLLTENLLV